MMLKIGVDVLKDEEKFLEVLYSLENKEEIITILKTRLVLGENVPIKNIIERSEADINDLKKIEEITFKVKKLYLSENGAESFNEIRLRSSENYLLGIQNLSIHDFLDFNFLNNNYGYNFFNLGEISNRTYITNRRMYELYLTKDNSKLYLKKIKNSIQKTRSSFLGWYSNDDDNDNEVYLIEPEYNKQLIEFIVDITLKKNLKNKKSSSYFNF